MPCLIHDIRSQALEKKCAFKRGRKVGWMDVRKDGRKEPSIT